jgi:hypothetical protein
MRLTHLGQKGFVIRIGQSIFGRFKFCKTTMRFSHQAIDKENKLQDRLLAQRLRRDTRLLRLAQTNLRRWKARDGKRPRSVFVEWQRILDYLSAKEIADFLVSDTPMARRLRQSSPFMGLFPKPGRPPRRK